MSEIVCIGPSGEPLNPKAVLMNVFEIADNIEDLIIVGRRKDNDGVEVYGTTSKAWFLYGAASILSDMALKDLNGHVIMEKK